jgi:hypothetical protein
MLLHVLRAWAGRRLVTHDVPGRPFYREYLHNHCFVDRH